MERATVAVVEVTEVGEEAIALVLETPPAFDGLPGQFVKLITNVDGSEESRFYTISSPDVSETFELTIEIDPDGDVSPVLRGLDPGDEVTLSGPYGNAYFEGESSVLILAGGPGIGPAVGISERTLDEGGSAAIVYRDDQPIHADRLETLEDRDAFVRVLDPAESLVESIEAADVSDRQIFVYGFVDFLDDVMDALVEAGADPEQAKVENFG